MSKIIFTKQEIETLQNNTNVASVSERSITYTDALLQQLSLSVELKKDDSYSI